MIFEVVIDGEVQGEINNLDLVTSLVKKVFGDSIIRYDGLDKVKGLVPEEDHWEGQIKVEEFTGHKTYQVEAWEI